MQYIKKVLALKNTETSMERKNGLSGILRVEIESGVAEFYLSLINLPKNIFEDYYALFIDSEKKEYEFNLGSRPSSSARLFHSEPKIDKGFCFGVYTIKESLPLTLAFASDCSFLSLQDFKRVVAEKCLIKHKNSIKAQEKENIAESVQCERYDLYNDEAVATENYFEIDEEINQKILSLKERENEDLQFENELSDCDCQEKTQKDFAPNLCAEDEKDTAQCEENNAPRHYDTVKAELNEIFFKFPEEESLKNHFKDSRWARIYYSSEKYYVVGVIREDGEEKYICYGVPANYSKSPPKELKGFCSFIPISVFDMFGAGYWMMFQDAVSGKCVLFN